jgi:uncharacterized protein (UPF0332 family)
MSDRPADSATYVIKAQQALAGAELEFANALYNNTVNRAYYACYQAAVAALRAEGFTAPIANYWSHDHVQIEFPARLIDERQRYSRSLRTTLKAVFDERLKADYEPELISADSAAEALRRAREFVGQILRTIDSQ